MTVNEYIESDYQHLIEAANKISGNHKLAQESLHYALDDFLTKKNAQDVVNSGGGRFYIVAILLKCWRSNTSPFHRTYLSHTKEITDEHDIQEEDEDNTLTQFKLAQELLNRLDWYSRMLFDLYVSDNHTISSLARVTGIPRTSVSLTIHRVKEFLQKELKKAL